MSEFNLAAPVSGSCCCSGWWHHYGEVKMCRHINRQHDNNITFLPLWGTLHDFNKVQIIQNVPKPLRVSFWVWNMASAVKKQVATLNCMVLVFRGKATNKRQKQWSSVELKRPRYETVPLLSPFWHTNSFTLVKYVIPTMWQIQLMCLWFDHTLLLY